MGRALCLILVVMACDLAIAQEYAAIFDIEGAITSDCERQTPIEHIARVVIFWDYDQNGRSEGDFPIPIFTYPEHSQANLFEFYAEDPSGIQSPVYLAFLQNGDLPNFYLCLYPWPGEVIEWVSPTFTLTPHEYSDPEMVSLPFEQWGCGEPTFSRPSCTPAPWYLRANNGEPWPDPIEVRFCPESVISIRVVDSLHIYTDYRLPCIEFHPSQTRLPSRAYLDLDRIVDWTSWSYLPAIGLDYGYTDVTFLDGPPCGTVDTFTVQREGSSVRIRWNTLNESNLSHFEIWRDHAIGFSWLRHVADVPAVDSINGAQYEFLDVDFFEAYLWYTIVQVANDSLKYADMRAYLPWATDPSDPQPVLPGSIRLIGSYPNPFNATTQIEFELPVTSRAILQIFDINGRLVSTLADERFAAGSHTVVFDGNGLASGLYFARLSAGNITTTHKMVLLK